MFINHFSIVLFYYLYFQPSTCMTSIRKNKRKCSSSAKGFEIYLLKESDGSFRVECMVINCSGWWRGVRYSQGIGLSVPKPGKPPAKQTEWGGHLAEWFVQGINSKSPANLRQGSQTPDLQFRTPSSPLSTSHGDTRNRHKVVGWQDLSIAPDRKLLLLIYFVNPALITEPGK